MHEDEKFKLSKRQVMERYIDLSDRSTNPDVKGMQDVTHLIWPESAFPFFLAHEPGALAQIAKLLSDKAVLITGGVRADEPPPSGPVTRAYNSIYVVGHDGTILSIYDKVHLVPFGEYLPLQPLLERFGLMQLTEVPGGFLAGDRRRILSVPGAPSVLPLICYEIIFPHAVVPGPERPHWLVNVTNDAWFGDSPGPHQHLQQARVQAIAEGLPLVRAANTGVSAVVDPLGRVTKSLALGTAGVLDAQLPERSPQTFYARTGDTPLGLVLAASLIIVIRRRGLRT
jgi:apolipoprotein N-acyltransferase